MSTNPRLLKNPIRLVIGIEEATIKQIDALMAEGLHHRHRNRTEFFRLAAERELARCAETGK